MIFRFLFGLILGSFLSAFTFRYPRKIQFLKGRSFCPHCKKNIVWFDNIPLLSFIFLGGRCRHCRKRISFRYPLIELATATGFLLIGWNIYWLAIFCILFAILIIDFERQIIPDSLVFLGFAFSLYAIRYTLFLSLVAGFFSASFLLLIHLATRGRGMGLGDVKFAVLGGALVGPKLAVPWLLLSFLTGAMVSIILILWGKKRLKDKIAFGPFLVIAIPVSLWLNSLSLFQSFLF